MDCLPQRKLRPGAASGDKRPRKKDKDMRKFHLAAPLALALLLGAGLGAVHAETLPADAAGKAWFSGRDPDTRPGNDFFLHANGAWQREAVIPGDRPVAGVMPDLQELADRRVNDLIRETAARDNAPGSDARRIADTYNAFMDEATIETRGLAPLQGELDAIAAIGDRRDLARAIGHQLRADVDVLNATHIHTDNVFGLWVAQDLDHPERYAGFLLQGGLGMPDRDYYLDPAPRMDAMRKAYAAYVATLLQLAGASAADAQSGAQRVLALEVAIAQGHADRVSTEDPHKGNNPWERAQFAQQAPGLDWAAFFEAAGVPANAPLVAWQPGALRHTAALAASEPLDTWRIYLRAHLLDQYARVLPKAFVEASYNFFGRTLQGTTALPPRWKRAVARTNDALGEAVGRLYVERYFPPAEKQRAERMVHDLIEAFGRRIDALAWMSPQTRSMARAKLTTLKVGVGYPDRWRDYSGLATDPADALGNLRRAEKFELARNLAKFGRPVDRDEWVMNPQLVNAVNLPAVNAIQFPAAILQPPLFSAQNTAAMNFGATGATIGHEISHSFDSEGAQFDAQGRLRNWWTPEDLAHFEAAGAALVRQFDAYRPFPDLALRGRQTLDENIADLAGLAVAYDGYRLSLAQAPVPERGGLDGDQQFFMSFAQSWREKMRDDFLRQIVVSDGHSPPHYRALTVRNLDAWVKAFAVVPGDALYLAPGERVRIW
jgi:predicted metalloendopeptidase